jgi:hypothetical protein
VFDVGTSADLMRRSWVEVARRKRLRGLERRLVDVVRRAQQDRGLDADTYAQLFERVNELGEGLEALLGNPLAEMPHEPEARFVSYVEGWLQAREPAEGAGSVRREPAAGAGAWPVGAGPGGASSAVPGVRDVVHVVAAVAEAAARVEVASVLRGVPVDERGLGGVSDMDGEAAADYASVRDELREDAYADALGELDPEERARVRRARGRRPRKRRVVQRFSPARELPAHDDDDRPF